MEKKIGKNVSSGAKKVETVVKENEFTAENVNKPVKTVKKTTTKKTTAKKPTVKKQTAASAARKEATAKAKKKESAAAEKRVEKAKAKAAKKEKKLMHKAELKQKKYEKKAALKEKKLARKEMLAKKAAERKQKKAERRAALKEKKVERRAERIARREMLKNESKAERNKRLAREKKERIAAKRQRQEARQKAHENKMKARNAARARKAQDKKHKREQRTERKKQERGFGGWLAAVISLGAVCLALATVVTAGALRMNDMTLSAENNARATLFEMVSVSEQLDNNLDKLRIASGANEQRNLLTDVLVESALMESALEKIPVDQATSTNISDFVNRTNRYANMLLNKLARGGSLDEQEKNTIAYLYEINSKLYNELNELATHMTKKDFRQFLSGGQGAMSEKFTQMGEGTRKEPEDIVDAPFAQQGNVGENKLSSLEEITSARAEELVREYLGGYHIAKVNFTGEALATDFTCFNFVLTDENENEIFAQITKNGGKLAFFDTYEECTDKNFDLETCDAIARDFLEELGIDNVEAVWLSDGGMVANLTYVTTDGGVRAYPDLIRVRVCESKGRVVGIDARGYLVNYGERSYGDTISQTEAEARLAEGLEPTASNLALIPLEGKEVLAYEFACNYGEEQFIVYVDAKTGEEIRIFRVRNSAQGSYLE